MSKNKKGAVRRKRIIGIAKKVALGGIPRLAVEGLLKRNKKKLQKFVANEGGIVPSENIEELAVQTAQVRAKKIEEIKDDPTIDADTTEDAAEVFEEQQAEEIETESYDGESDAFTEEVLGAALGVAKGVVKKIKERRAKKGKKSGFLDKLSGAKVDTTGRGSVEISGITNPNSSDPLSVAVRDAQSGATETIIKKNLPIIIIVVVVIAFFMMKKK